MKVLIQRVKHSRVKVEETTVGEIQQGLLLLIGIEKQDSTQTLEKMANKVLNYRVFSDEQGKMNLSVKAINGGILAVSQFTLAAETRKGLRPGFSSAAPQNQAEEQYLEFVDILRRTHQDVAVGQFAADMQVELINDGPVTFLLEM